MKFASLLCWLFHIALIYTAFNPDHVYQVYLANARVLYLVVTVPAYILFGIITLMIGLNKDMFIQAGVEKAKKELVKDKETLEKTLKEIATLDKKFTLLNFSRLFGIFTTMIVFISLGDTFLGTTMLFGSAVLHFFIGYIKEFTKELERAFD